MALTGWLVLVLSFIAAVFADPLDTATYYRLVSHWKYATSAYQSSCQYPNSKILIKTFSNTSTGVYGYIARDDVEKDFIVAFRGWNPSTLTSAINTNKTLAILRAPHIPNFPQFPPRVHAGFLAKYNSVAKVIHDTIYREIVTNDPTGKYELYYVTSVGHNVGGALAMINSVALRYMFVDMGTARYAQGYTYGLPRMGNVDWSALISEVAGDHRVVHTNDGVPKIIPKSAGENGWAHHPREYWNFRDPPSASTTKMCREYGDGGDLGEDNLCSISVKTNTVNDAHWKYFNIPYNTAFCTRSIQPP